MDSCDVAPPRAPVRLAKLAPMAMAAIGGILAAELLPGTGAGVWCGCFGVMVVWFGRDPRAFRLLMAVAAAFGLMHALTRAELAVFPLAKPLAEEKSLAVTVVGVVTEMPVVGESSIRFPLRLERLQTGEGSWKLRAPVMVKCPLAATGKERPRCGDRLRIAGWLSPPPPARNPGEFDSVQWLYRQGMVGELRVRQLTLLEAAAELPFKRLAMRARDWLAAAMTLDLDDRPAEKAVIKAMVLGTREDMDDDAQAAFQQSGTLHIFSVSGLHVGLVAVILWRVLNLFQLGRRHAAWASLPLIFFYAFLTGWQPAAVRSAMMAGMVLLGICLNRPLSFSNSLCLAALVILAGDTHQLFMAGAQLSFVVIGVIALGTPWVSPWLVRCLHPDPWLPRELWRWHLRWAMASWRWLSQMLAVSVVAAAGSSWLTFWHFQMATPVSLAANLVHVPLAGLILSTAGLSAAASAWWPWLAMALNNANLVFAELCLVTAGWFAQVPGGSVLWNPRLCNEPAPACRLTVFDVGDGGSVLIRTLHDRAWLLDTGRLGDFRGIVRPGLTYHAVKRLDGLIVSHGDTGHVGGAAEALMRLTPAALAHPGIESRSPGLRAALMTGAPEMPILRAGQTLRLDEGTTVSVLWPRAEASGPLADDSCAVLLLECAGRRILFTNDAGFLAERALARDFPHMRVDVWIRGRHADDLSGQEEFLKRVRPSLVVVAGEERLPEAWRTMAEAVGARVFDQTETGAVDIMLRDDGRLTAGGFLTSSEDRFHLGNGNSPATSSR